MRWTPPEPPSGAPSICGRDLSPGRRKRQSTPALPTAADLFVRDLPGLAESRLALFAGNIPSSVASNPPGPRDSDAHLYFLLSRAKHLPKRERLVIWLNGGPGCSSFDGALVELGPLRITPEGGVKVVENTAWNEYANVLFLDQPAGTGFSYVTKNDKVHELADAAQEVVIFFNNFYRIFPEFASMDTYIAGESYAGMYIPYIADAITKTTLISTPLKGLLIGNGWISPREQYPAYLTAIEAGGFVRKGSQEYRNVEAAVERCKAKIADMNSKMSNSKGLVLVGECEAILGALAGATMKDGRCLNLYDTREYQTCGAEWPRDLVQVTQYLRRPDVIKALHAEAGTRGKEWTQCSPAVGAKFWTPNSQPAVVLLPGLLEKMPVLLYGGDRDIMCANAGIEAMIDEMEWNGAKGWNGSTPLDWYVGGEFAGLWTTARNLTYIDFYNASHMVPMDKPIASHDMILRFMQVDTLNAAGSAARIPSRIGNEQAAVLGAVHPNGTTLPGAELAVDADADTSNEKEVTEDGFDIDHERYYGPRRTAALVFLLVVVGGAIWAILRWRTRRRKARYRRLKGKGRAMPRLGDSEEGGYELEEGRQPGAAAFRDDDRSAGSRKRAEPVPTETPETAAVFNVGEDDDDEDEDDSFEKVDEEGWGDLGRADEA
ncbi:hypothetical protein JCM8097_000825 [Rhodosporidiobolus ruineniae]